MTPKRQPAGSQSDVAAKDYGFGHGFVVLVYQGSELGQVYGTFEKRDAAERKAAAIRKRANPSRIVRVLPLRWATTPADQIAGRMA